MMNIHNLSPPLYIAHRGLSARFPENTLAAFNAAADAGAHMIELDVSLSKDRQMVVIHDDTVDRTTNGSGRVRALTMDKLSRLDAGSWFDSRFSGERPPTLAQVLDTVRGRLLVNIEIKPEAFEPNGPEDAIEQQVWQLVQDKEMADDVLVSSFEWRVLENLRRLAPTITIGLLSDKPADGHLFDWIEKTGAFSWHPDYRVLTAEQVTAAHQVGVKVFPYAVGGHIDTRKMLAMGVDGTIQDEP